MTCGVLRKIPETNTEFLARRYGVRTRTITNWKKYLGLSCSRKLYPADAEIEELDRLYVMCGVWRGRSSHWRGLRMSVKEYQDLIVDQGLSLDYWLQSTHGITYEEYIAGLESLNRRSLFGN
jgi:hypothetical protein